MQSAHCDPNVDQVNATPTPRPPTFDRLVEYLRNDAVMHKPYLYFRMNNNYSSGPCVRNMSMYCVVM